MVKLDVVRSINATLVIKQPLVAVFTGTAGIGGLALRALATTHGKTGKGLRVYVIGRNPAKIQKQIDECQILCPPGQFVFVQGNDLALVKDVDEVCKDLIAREEKEAAATGQTARIDILLMCHAIFEPFSGKRNETSEGLDTFMSLLYYSRMRFTTRLLPLLLTSTLPAHVISVYAPGRDAAHFLDTDVSLRDPQKYGFMSSGSHAAYLTTFYMEYLAAKYEGKLALVHYLPGLVLHDNFDQPGLPGWLRFMVRYLSWMFYPFTVKTEESGERTLFNASGRFSAKTTNENGKSDEVAVSSEGIGGGGAYRVNWNGEPVPLGKFYGKLREDGWLEKAVEHTQKAFAHIEAEGKFLG